MSMIENSERGITLNKPLAWSIATALVVGGIYFGTTVTTLEQSLQSLDDRVIVQRNASEARETRLRALENNLSKSEERVANILSLLSRIDARLERIERAQTEAR